MCINVRGWRGIRFTSFIILIIEVLLKKNYEDIRYLDKINFKNVIEVIWSNFSMNTTY